MLAPELRFVDRTKVLFEGKKYTLFGGNDYHRLSSHPEVLRAVAETAQSEGLSGCGSRTTTGNHPVYGRLESAAAEFLGTGSAAVFSSGYLAASVLLQAVAGEFQRFFVDAGAHSSVLEAALQAPREAVHDFEHSDGGSLWRRIKDHLKKGERPLVLTDGVSPGTGDIPPLGEYHRLIKDHGGMLLIDDSHGLAVVGKTGKGSREEAALPEGSWLQAGTLSKGFGAFGGIVAGSRELIEKVHSRSLAFIGSTGLPIPIAAGAIKSIEILKEHPEMITGLRERMAQVKQRIRTFGFVVNTSPAPIVSFSLHDEAKNSKLRERLLAAGIYPPFINYPGSPPGGHFRFTFSGAHGEEEIEALMKVLEGARG